MRVRKVDAGKGPLRMEASRAVETVVHSKLSEAEVLEANLRALGISPDRVGGDREDRAYAALLKSAKETKDLVTIREVAKGMGASPGTAGDALRQLVRQGRAFERINARTNKPGFIPKVV